MANSILSREHPGAISGIVRRKDVALGFKILRGCEASHSTWLDMILRAKREILLEMYWFATDSVGKVFAETLAARAREGLDVRVLVDAFGSFESDALLSELERTGVKVHWYNPILPWARGFRHNRVGKRDHRKVIVVDGGSACVGGINITEKSEPWHDYSVLVHNTVAAELRELFFETWHRSQRDVTELGADAKNTTPHIGSASAPVVPSETQANAPFQIVAKRSWVAHRALRRLYLTRIRNAKERILIENAYFVPDTFIRNALVRAARRGVEVRILVPEISDLPSVDLASRAGFKKLLKAGVHIHRWPNGILHAKVAVIDSWATVGSYNLDYRSFFHNLEVNIATSDRRFVEELTENLRSDLEGAPELEFHAWRDRSVWTRFLEWIAYQFRKFL
jgi:cardiolipin synthase A/B